MHSELGAGLSADHRLTVLGPLGSLRCTASGMHRIRPATDSSSSIIASPPGRCRGFPDRQTFASEGARPAHGLNDFKRTSMMRLFARRQDSRSSSEPRTGSAPPRAADRPGRAHDGGRGPRPRRSIRACSWPPGNLGMADATASPDLSDRVAQALKPYFDQDQIPGISVAIVTDGQVALAQGYGLSNVATGSPVAGRHPVRHRFGDEDVHRPRRPAPLPGEPGHVPPARPQRPDQSIFAQ